MTDGLVVAAGARERCELRLRAQPLGAELDANLRSVARARPRQTLVDGRFCFGPSALPEGELGEVTVVEYELVVLAQGGARGLEVRSRGVELAAADLDVSADGEEPDRKLDVMPRRAAALSLSASSQSPIASSASIRFATSRGC